MFDGHLRRLLLNATTYFRWTLTLLLIWAVFFETGGWTTLAFGLLFIRYELSAWRAGMDALILEAELEKDFTVETGNTTTPQSR
jgi:hypothetical protein